MPETSGGGTIQPPITSITLVTALTNAGPADYPGGPPNPAKGNVAAFWGYVGPNQAAPQQTSSPPITCAVYGQGGVIGVSGGASPIADADAAGDGVIGFGSVNGVHGFGTAGSGVGGTSTSGSGVYGKSESGAGVFGTSSGSDGVHGESQSSQHAGVYGSNSAGGFGVWASGKPAGYFNGDVTITGDITSVNTITVKKNVEIDGDITSVNTITVKKGGDVVLEGGDCAEQFDTYDEKTPEPGTIMVIDDGGTLRESQHAYDRRVAGVVSGAGEYRPAIVLDRRASPEGRVSVALVGKVYCKVDADPAPIAVGDLLTTSARPGFGMKATDPGQAFGAVIGKALQPLRAGQGMIPILVALQ